MKYFGTDGVRGQSNTFPLTAEMALKIGMAAAVYLRNKQNNSGYNRVIIGKDTRLSGYMFEHALVAGLASMGNDVMLLGPVPTPAVAMLTASMKADLGIMISASHNPFYDNGIKIFNNQGYKLSNEDEANIESLLETDLSNHLVKSESIGRVERLKETAGRYIQFAKSSISKDVNFEGLKIVLDTANGAAYKIAPIVFFELGAEVISIGDSPNGININLKCGSTHIEKLRGTVLSTGADIGLAFDGDADRLIAVDERGNVINGDKILAVIAKKLKDSEKLNSDTIACTVMSNMGLTKYLRSHGIKTISTNVGDRYVSEAIINNDLSLGGEQSGHIILPHYCSTGDGIIAGLQLVEVLVQSKQPASIVLNPYEESPQILTNISYYKNNPLELKDVQNYIQEQSTKYADTLRILVRKSGTEPLIRVMVEGDDHDLMHEVRDRIVRKLDI